MLLLHCWGGALVFQGGYHPRKTNVIRVVTRLFTHMLRGAKRSKTRKKKKKVKKGVFYGDVH